MNNQKVASSNPADFESAAVAEKRVHGRAGLLHLDDEHVDGVAERRREPI